MTIDAHHHFWKYNPAEYGWIDEAMASIRRDFLPADLKREITAAGVDGVISVQARQSLEETRWLLDLADRYDFIRGVVGWINLAASTSGEEIERFAANPKLRAVRHVLQGESDEYMSRADFNAGVKLLAPRGLAYDILIFERQLPAAIAMVDRHPNQVFILDHLAKPRIKENILSPWGENLRQVARRDNVFCKISGMVTEADYHAWTIDQLRPYIHIPLEAFGPDRLMFGSDWPVCLVACAYKRWVELIRNAIAPLSPDEQAAIMGRTAVRAYQIP